LLTGPLPTYSENFIHIRLAVLHEVANRQTGKQLRKHNLLGGGNNHIETEVRALIYLKSIHIEV